MATEHGLIPEGLAVAFIVELGVEESMHLPLRQGHPHEGAELCLHDLSLDVAVALLLAQLGGLLALVREVLQRVLLTHRVEVSKDPCLYMLRYAALVQYGHQEVRIPNVERSLDLALLVMVEGEPSASGLPIELAKHLAVQTELPVHVCEEFAAPLSKRTKPVGAEVSDEPFEFMPVLIVERRSQTSDLNELGNERRG